jgi:hypothetical protein
MNSIDVEIRIPAAITALPLTIAEKIVLTHIDIFPGCTNARLAKLVGGTCRGVENLLRHLRNKGYITQSGKGRARRHRLLFPMEHHTLGGDKNVTASVTKSHTSCADQRIAMGGIQVNRNPYVLVKERPLHEEIDHTLGMIHELCHNNTLFPESIVSLYGGLLKRVVEEAPECPAKTDMIRELTIRRDAFVAISFAQRLPKRYHRQAGELIHNATPEKLA